MKKLVKIKKSLLRIRFFRACDAFLRSVLGILPIAHSLLSQKKEYKEADKIFIFLHGGLGDVALRVPLLQNLAKYYEVTALVPGYSKEIIEKFCVDVTCITYNNKNVIDIFRITRRITDRKTVFFSTSPVIESYIIFFISHCSSAFGILGFENLVMSIGFRFKARQISEKNKYNKYKRLFEIYESVGNKRPNDFADTELKQKIRTNSVIIAPNKTDGWPAGRWPIEDFARVIDRLESTFKVEIKVVGSSVERDYADRLLSLCIIKTHTNLAGRTTLRKLFYELENAALVICNDSGVMHLSALVGTPCISIFSFSDPEVFAWPKLTVPVSNHVFSCMPCVGHRVVPQDNYPFKCPYMSRCDSTVRINDVEKHIHNYLS